MGKVEVGMRVLFKMRNYREVLQLLFVEDF